MARITGCIVTYNNADKIEQAIASILEHTAELDFELYISDNLSTDGTPALVRERFPQVKVIENGTNKGFGSGHNAVLPLLCSQYHIIINPDIVLRDNAVGELCAYFDANSDVMMAVPKLLNPDGTEQFTPKLRPTLHYMLGGRLERLGNPFRRWRSEYTMRGVTVTEPVDVGFCSGCFIVIRTEVFRKIGGFDERYFLYSEDADLTRSAQQYGRTVYYPNAAVVHLWERAYMKKKKYFLIQLSSMFKYFRKWRGKK